MKPIIAASLALLGEKFTSPEAVAMLLAIGYQESGWAYRKQIVGPARGFYQFESIAVTEVLTHRATADTASYACRVMKYSNTTPEVHNAIKDNDVLATMFARLLLWRDPAALPAIGEQNEAWHYYQRNWCPGKPHPDRWNASYQYAMEQMK